MEFHQEDDQEEEEEEMPHPINSTYGHNNNNKNNHLLPLSLHNHHKPPNATITTINVTTTITPLAPPPQSSMVVVVRYKECLKNHAASLGGKATDGCGEFMPSGEEGTRKALICSVCNCHRNFHRKEIEGDPYFHHLKRFDIGNRRNLILQGHPPIEYNHNINTNNSNNNNNNVGALVPSRGPPHMIKSYNMGMGSFPSESAYQEDGGGGFMGRYLPVNHPPPEPLQQVVKKRFRTKFTQEQKEKMVNFAEKVEWKIQRQEESLVQEFCQEIGIKRRVLKVWMHNNKQNLAKNTNSISIYPPQDPNHSTN